MTSTIILPPSSNDHQNSSSAAPPPPPAAVPPPTQAAQREIWYNGQVYQDIPAWTIEQVRDQLAQTYPEASSANWTETTQTDGTVRVDFVKVTGEKG